MLRMPSQTTPHHTLPTVCHTHTHTYTAADHSGAAGGSSRRVASMSKTARRGASKLSGQSVLRHGQDLVQDLLRATSNTPDAVLLLGGDLTVQVLQAQVREGRGHLAGGLCQGGAMKERLSGSGGNVATAQANCPGVAAAQHAAGHAAKLGPLAPHCPPQLQGLAGQPKSTHAFARVYINEPFPSEGGEGQGREEEVHVCVRAEGHCLVLSSLGCLVRIRWLHCCAATLKFTLNHCHCCLPLTPAAPEDPRAKQTSVVWQTCSPVWDESLVFRDVCTASELVVS